MKKIRLIGLLLFIASMLIFVAILFMGKYKLTEESISSSINNKKSESFFIQKGNELGLIDKEFSNQFEFSSTVSNLIVKGNEFLKAEITKEKGFTDSEIQQLIENSIQDNKVVYSKESIENSLSNEDKITKLAGSTSWMFSDQKEYGSIEEFKELFQNKIKDVNSQFSKDLVVYDNKYSQFDFVKQSSSGYVKENKGWLLFLSFGLGILGSLMFIISALFLDPVPGIKNNGIYLQAATNRGFVGVIVFGFLVSFYVLLYFYPYYITNWTLIMDPLKSVFIKDGSASQWFLYGILYCVSMIVMGIRMFIKYRHNNYQMVRTASVLFFQIIFAFLLVELLPLFDLPGVDLKNAWPLDYNFLTDWNIKKYLDAGHLGKFMFFWGIILSIIVVPLMVYIYGKRWYCSWVCGCGGLAETLGDPYRQLSDKRLIAWKLERWILYPVMIFAIVMTVVVGYNTYHIIQYEDYNNATFLGINAYRINEWYGFLIGSIFAGVIGTGFYPILGNRTWCRFGCPLAAYMGLVQKFKSRFRITTNGGQCISCGNCSTYCEQGIDVRAYAQKGQNIVRASCVGCGICSAVCPRGVLKLENGPTENRVDDLPIILGNDGIAKLNDNLK